MKIPTEESGNLISSLLISLLRASPPALATDHLEVDQITHGPEHHFDGYIDHVQNIPWNGSERYIVALWSWDPSSRRRGLGCTANRIAQVGCSKVIEM